MLLVTERQGEDVLSPRPARRHGDVVAFRIAHRERAVIATITMRSLTRHDRLFGAVLQLRTASARYTAVLYRSGVRQPLTSRFDGGGTHGCDRMSFDVDHADDTVTISVPRSCLGDPAWVASRAVIDYFGPSGLGSGFFADAAPGSGLSHIPFLPKAWHPRG